MARTGCRRCQGKSFTQITHGQRCLLQGLGSHADRKVPTATIVRVRGTPLHRLRTGRTSVTLPAPQKPLPKQAA